jgi:FkbM family methyltransferase
MRERERERERERINFSFKQQIYFLLRHIITIVIKLLKNERFISISLPFFTKQIFYDRINKKIVKFKIRDEIDYLTASQIFINEDYNLKKFTRFEEINNYQESLVKKNLKPLIIDCGGHIGLASKYFSIIYPHSKIILIEPEIENFNNAIKNNLNNANIEFLNVAIGSENTKCQVFDPGIGSWGYRTIKNNNGDLNIISVNQILREYKKENEIPFIIKIDIEGFENELFSKNIEWIDIFPIIIIELHDWMLPKTSNSMNFLSSISNKNRDFLYAGENIFSIKNDK